MSAEQTSPENVAFRLRVFISYSRKDTDFVDRLEADLRARDIYVWVDRQKLEGGTNWLDQIQQAIDKCNVMITVLSPDFISSKFTKMEYEYGFTSGRQLLPILYRPVEKVSLVFNNIQWATKFQQDYETGLQELLVILGNYLADEQPSSSSTVVPKLPQSPVSKPIIHTSQPDWDEFVAPNPLPTPQERDLEELYRLGFSAKAQNDFERMELYWQQIVDRNPNFRNGYIQQELRRFEKQIKEQRLARLRRQAYNAYRKGEFDQERANWRAILTVDPKDSHTKMTVDIIDQNQAYVWLYDNVKHFLSINDMISAKSQLIDLIEKAPYFPDYLNIMVQLNVTNVGKKYDARHPYTQEATNFQKQQKEQQIAIENREQIELEKQLKEQEQQFIAQSFWDSCKSVLQWLFKDRQRYENYYTGEYKNQANQSKDSQRKPLKVSDSVRHKIGVITSFFLYVIGVIFFVIPLLSASIGIVAKNQTGVDISFTPIIWLFLLILLLSVALFSEHYDFGIHGIEPHKANPSGRNIIQFTFYALLVILGIGLFLFVGLSGWSLLALMIAIALTLEGNSIVRFSLQNYSTQYKNVFLGFGLIFASNLILIWIYWLGGWKA